MSLNKDFPEIKNFFNYASFTQEDLEHLKIKVLKEYENKNIYKAAISLIKLELLKFKLVEKLPKTKNKKITKAKLEKQLQSIPDSYSLKVLAEGLQVSKAIIIQRLIDKGCSNQNFVDDRIINREELFLIKELIISRIKLTEKKEKSKKLVTKKKHNKSNYTFTKHGLAASTASKIPVYDKIEKYGLGKLIYIRKRS